MTEEYIEWLVHLYHKYAGQPDHKYIGQPVGDPEVIVSAIAVIRWHNSRGPGCDEFVSVVAAAMADRLEQLANRNEPFPPFVKLLNQVADAARHRILREARKHVTNSTELQLEGVPDRTSSNEMSSVLLADELTSEFSLEENQILAMSLEGIPIEDAAEKVGVSPRTIYRRLTQIKQRLIVILKSN